MALHCSITKVPLFFVLGWIGCMLASHAAEPNWPILEFTSVASGVPRPVDIQNAADGSNRLFLVGQDGEIRILKNGALLETPLLDVGDRIGTYAEQGLLGLAFPPNFAEKKCFYNLLLPHGGRGRGNQPFSDGFRSGCR
ncbi:hypothetical protein ACFSSA_03775 [Luteolibacter algae]|uniref:Glucose/Sorbosone dehydrogenase domain-containing protein n=1 Tax=Luteolibacter algae TaxID=454151 RepID=A0ABW5D873_9BACT